MCASQIFSASVRATPLSPFRLRLAFRDGSIQYMNNSSGVGVLDKTVSVLSALESGPASLAQLVKATGLARPTAHRIAVALETHRLLTRDAQGRFVLGPRIGELAAAAGEDRRRAVPPTGLLHAQGHARGRGP